MTEEVRQALRICPPGLRQAIDRLPDAGAMEELRLRCGQPPACRIAGKERALPLAPVTPELLRGILEQATQRSTYAMQEMTRCGFVTLPGGHRLGICGTAVVQNGTITALREPSSLNLRIARQPDGIADRLRDALWARPQSVLLCGAPGSGKTTLLRDLIRQLSDRFGWRICAWPSWTSGWSWRPVPPACRNSALARTRTCCPVHRRRRASSCCCAR